MPGVGGLTLARKIIAEDERRKALSQGKRDE